jgi:mRNA-degrading endonuclease RelE of RelBE toxin-antitoxin system
MNVTFNISPEFERNFKRLFKKYPSLIDDVDNLKKELTDNPLQGTDLGNHVRKVRMAIASKGKGKSGGSRILTYNIATTAEGNMEITLLTIYDKGEISNVTDAYIKWLVSLV